MKKLFSMICIFIIILLFSCTDQVTKEIITKETKTVITNDGSSIKLVKIFPVDQPSAVIGMKSIPMRTEKKNKDVDFEDGRMYVENSFNGDGIIHTLDLSPLIGNNKSAYVSILTLWVNGCQDESFTAWFRPKKIDSGLNEIDVKYEGASCHYNESSRLIIVPTNADGDLEWYHDYTWNFLHSDVEKWMDIEIWAYCFVNNTVNN